jgi:hypothetical protein
VIRVSHKAAIGSGLLFVTVLLGELPAAGQMPGADGALAIDAASINLNYPLAIGKIAVATNSGSMVIDTVSPSGQINKIGFDGSSDSRERWTFILGGDRLHRGSREETIVVNLLSAWVCTNMSPDVARAVSSGRYSDAEELVLSEGKESETNSICLRILDVLTIVVREQKKSRSRTSP